jgi:two-component system, LytTR family, sensor kinase
MKMNRQNIVFNLVFWFSYFLYEWLSNAALSNEYRRYLINASVFVPLTFCATMFTLHVVVQRYFLKGKQTRFWIFLILSMIAFAIMRRSFNYYYNYPLYWPEGLKTTSLLFFPKVLIEGVSMYLIVALYGMFYFMKAWYEQQRKTQAILRDKIEAQLELLKSQVQPHFIFNTLNNIYALSLQQHARTSELIYRLSALLSYMLYDSKQQAISLEKELEYINNYIELEKIRYGDRLDIAINIFDRTDHFQIAPLLLLPIIENSFKHGVNKNVDDCWIRIDVTVHDEWLSVKVENSYNGINGHGNGNGNGHTNKNGIGIDNVKQRLEILYPARHEFKNLPGEHSFLTILKIKNLRHESKMPDHR